MDRMKERMTLAHKNTSKWARRVLRRGAKMDVEERRALSLQIAKGEELRKKVMGEESGGEVSDEEGETEEELLKRAREILMEDDDEGVTGDTKKKGLFQLEFMQRGMEMQRTRAKEEARRLLEELEANAVGFSSDSEDDEDCQQESAKKTKPKVASAAETNKVLPEGKLVASSLQFGKADGFSIAVSGDIDLSNDAVADDEKEETGSVQEPSGGSSKKKRRKKKKGGDKVNESVTEVESQEEENPWIVVSDDKPTTKETAPPKAPKNKTSSSWTININDAAAMLVDATIIGSKSESKRKIDQVDNGTEESSKGQVEGVAALSQSELVRRAFAAPVDLEAEEEFQKEKVTTIVS
jgi:U3 small nucleolar RNA-associated protein 14